MSHRLPRGPGEAPERRGGRSEGSLAGWLALAALSISLLLLVSHNGRVRDCPRASGRPKIAAPWTVGVMSPRLLPGLV